MRYVLIGLVAALWLVFGVSSFSKVRSVTAHRAFVASLRPWQFLPVRFLALVAALVTGAEIAVVLGASWTLAGIMFRRSWRAAGLGTLVLAALLLIVLTIGIAVALRQGTEATCACFGVTERPLSGAHLVRDCVLLLAVLSGLALVAAESDRPTQPAGAMLGLVSGAVVGLIVVRLDDLVELFTSRPTS